MGDAVLTVVDLHARYGNVSVLLESILRSGGARLVAMLGANGVGKTTVLRAISGLLSPHAGTVRLLDQDITTHPAHKLRYIGVAHVREGLCREDLPGGRRAWVICYWRTRCSLKQPTLVTIPTPSVRQHDVFRPTRTSS